MKICGLKIDVSCEASVNFQHISQNNLHLVTSPSPDNAIRTKRATRHVESAAPATQNHDDGLQSAAPATKTATHFLQTPQKYCACHTKQFSTRYETRLNVTKCHACHAKRSNATFETSKNDIFCRTYHRHGHTALTRTVVDSRGQLRTVADGCGRLRTVAVGCGRKRNVERTHPQPPDPQSETGDTLATHSGKSRFLWKVNEAIDQQTTEDVADRASAFHRWPCHRLTISFDLRRETRPYPKVVSWMKKSKNLKGGTLVWGNDKTMHVYYCLPK